MKQMNGHPYTFEQLQSFVDGTLDKAISRQIEQHLASCAECQTDVAKLRALETKTAQALPADAPDKYFDTFGSRVSARIAARREAAPARRAWFARWGLVPAAAAAVLVLLIALNPEHSLRQQALVRERVGQADKAAPVAASQPEAARPGTVTSQAETAWEDKASAKKERQAEPGASLTAVAKDEVAAPALRASRVASSQASPPAEPAPVATATGRAETKSKQTAAPAPVSLSAGLAATTGKQPKEAAASLPGTELSCAPLAINQLQVIVIHLPDGKDGCPAPAIATAIEIVIPADCRSAN
jgi:hypothetical protein